ncbi:MAG: electron transport complex subunit RsxG [Cocleimonas sp.]|nr:electron transport complex subunit RsxG [Cocleimonas sp.]
MRKHFSAMKKAGLSLAFFAFISVLLVAMTNSLTKDKIIENQAMMLLSALNEVVPTDRYDNDLASSKIILTSQDTGFAKDTPVYLATLNGVPSTAIFEVTTLKGYSGAMTLLIGINANDQTLSGVRIVNHKETPGLGDKMETRKSNWVLAFNGKSLNNPDMNGWQVKKDGGKFDQFTGATITPRAIVNAIKSTLIYAQSNMNTLFQAGVK